MNRVVNVLIHGATICRFDFATNMHLHHRRRARQLERDGFFVR
jgi:hypothetical protein